MAVVYGNVEHLGMQAVPGLRLRFTLSEPVITGNTLIVTKTVEVACDVQGGFRADLWPTDNMSPGAYVKLQVVWPDADIDFIGLDAPQWVINIPTGGGNLADLIPVRLGPLETWVVDGGAIPSSAGTGDFLYDPTSNDLYRIEG